MHRFARQLAWRYRLPDPCRDAEDIVQATFEAALPRWSSLKHPTGWLYAVTRRQVTRTAIFGPRHGEPIWDELDVSEFRVTCGEPSVEDQVLVRQVLDAIAKLPDCERTAVFLRHVEGWAVQDVADLLRCAPGSVWSHTARGVQKLRDAFLPPTLAAPHLRQTRHPREWIPSHLRSPATPDRRPLPGRRPLRPLVGATVAGLVAWLVAGLVGWTVPWPEIGVGAAILIGLAVLVLQ